MLIQTLNRELMTVSVLYAGRNSEVQVCRDVLEERPRDYIVVKVTDSELAHKVIPYFLKLRGGHFTDFVGCFSQDGDFYAVFVHHDGTTMQHKMGDTPYSLTERLEIAKSLFTQIALLDIAPGILYEALRDENLLLDDALTVRFRYNLQRMGSYETLSELAVQVQLVQVLKRLFADELAKEICTEPAAFIQKLATKPYKDYVSMYADFDAVYVLLRGMQERGETKPQNIWWHIWEKIKRLGRFVKPTIAALMVAAAFAYLVYTLVTPPDTTGHSTVTYEKIGTVEVY